MARKRMITRTITSTTYTALCLDILTAEPCNKTVTLGGTLDDKDKALKAVKAALDTDTVKAVTIVDTEINEELYGMTEDMFLMYAEKLPARTPNDNTNTDTEEEN